MLLTYHYREVPQEKRGVLVPKAKKMIMEGGFKVIKYLFVLAKEVLKLNSVLLVTIYFNLNPLNVGWTGSLCFRNKATTGYVG